MTVQDTVLAHSRQTCDPHSHQRACLHNPKSLEAALTAEESPERSVVIRHVSSDPWGGNAALRAYFPGIDITGKLEDSFDQNVVCIKRRTARGKPFGARGS